MPPRSVPTARQRRLGAELRKLRDAASLSTTDAALRLKISQSRLSAIEGGRYGVSAERVRAFVRTYGSYDAELANALAAMPATRRRNWWDEYRDYLPSGLLDLTELEHHARSIRTAQVTHLPGLLQTVDYARTIFRQSIPELPPPMVEFRTSHRIKRQQILWADTPTPYTATVHEAALRMRFGGPETTSAQLTHLVEMSERDHVTVRVIPFEAGIFPGAGQTVLYAEGPVPQLDTVQLDTEHGSEQLHSDAQLAKYRTFLERFEAIALTPRASRDFVHRIVKTL
ncbi:Scr1 family TA system antitoxin-like transcriptional regulator [Streptomyces mayteni]